MLTSKPHTNARKAQAYFEEHLAAGDYYSESQAVAGEWFGEGAHRLALSGVVKRDEFLALCENRDPHTGGKLTARTRTTRRVVHADNSEGQVANRRLFYDFVISPPKSVSIAALVAGDERIVKAHERAARGALKELERFAATRVRKGGKCEDRTTRNLVAAMFRHDTSRALDPHLHSHCIVFNATFDPVENRWKALQNRDMYFARKYVENVYYHALARELRRFGYSIRNRARGDFELEGIPGSLLDKFSKRHEEIDKQTRELLAKRPELAGRNLAEVREHLAHSKRARKSAGVDAKRLRQWWEEQMSAEERQGLQRCCQDAPEAKVQPSAMDEHAALRWAEEHLFDRKSLVHEHELWCAALERARGEDFTLEALQAATANTAYLRDPRDERRLTTRPVMKREWNIICMASEGSNASVPLAPEWAGHAALDEAQLTAARKILKCLDRIILFRGGAGTGKSFTLKVVHDALLESGHAVQVLAPQRQQAEGLTLDGMAGAQTVSEFMTRKRMADRAVVIVDEAGQIGAKDMLALLSFVTEHRGRVILSGDTRQHGAVQASDALWAIEKYGRLHPAELNAIRRQDPARGRDAEEQRWIAGYRQAVEDASEGNIAASFDRLDEAGAIMECAPDEQQRKLAERYLELARNGESTLVVSPTWREIHKVNAEVRQALQAEGLIGGKEWKVTALQPEDLTDAQKQDVRYHPEGSVITFNQTVQGIPKGASGKLLAVLRDGLAVEAAGRIRIIEPRHLGRLTVCKAGEMALAKGDRLQLKANAQALKGERLLNGELVTVRKVGKSGHIRLEDGRVLPPQYRQFVRGYAVTSYASQGKTVDHVLISDSGVKAATHDRQWYVSISRARRSVRIFTADKEALRENVTRSGQRELAMDIIPSPQPMARIGQKLVPLHSQEFARYCSAMHQKARLMAMKRNQREVVRPQSRHVKVQ